MGREQKRREFKKNRKKIDDNNLNLEDEFKMSTVLKVGMSVLLILLALYYVLAIFVTKEIKISNGKDKDSSEVSDNQDSGVSNKILGSATFKQSEEVYYVYYYDFDDEKDLVSSAVSSISDNVVYRVDTGSSLNKNYVTDSDGNRSVSDVSGLKVVNPTVIKIDNDKVVEYYEGKDEIVNAFSK